MILRSRDATEIGHTEKTFSGCCWLEPDCWRPSVEPRELNRSPKSEGVDESGNADPNPLISQGWQRAGALVPLFSSSFGP
jgi:hypothetical protein